MAAFNGNSFIERQSITKLFDSIDLVFMSQSPDGILLYVNEKLTSNFFGIKIEDNFIVNFLKQYGEVKDLKGTSPYLKVIEFYNIKDAAKAFKALNGSPFAAGEIQCKWDWDLTTSTRVSYIKLTDEFIKGKIQNDESSVSESIKKYKLNESNKNMFIELFDKFISEHIDEIENIYNQGF